MQSIWLHTDERVALEWDFRYSSVCDAPWPPLKNHFSQHGAQSRETFKTFNLVFQQSDSGRPFSISTLVLKSVFFSPPVFVPFCRCKSLFRVFVFLVQSSTVHLWMDGKHRSTKQNNGSRRKTKKKNTLFNLNMNFFRNKSWKWSEHGLFRRLI